ncbi:hypothetical protein TU94_03535 [Streptomyces cyaneogriseus subsp. noncyanogenus]|uniref:Uncharacterized protein n=1 Tax=Streptomyces cyaneogriseus subsp. noncyanogenus TaxID=477245 RepID=A0A0C5G9E3_9ACTN|nr:hypothetical protein TU94_03535 [Streptomyces cyaneogriseus subsp. noncyanogenus]
MAGGGQVAAGAAARRARITESLARGASGASPVQATASNPWDPSSALHCSRVMRGESRRRSVSV